MQVLIDFLRLSRWLNLVYIALTQLLLRFCLIMPIYLNGFVAVESSLSNGEFALLVLSTVLVAAAGYIINDYFDVKSDEINKPERIIIGRSISKRRAIIWHFILSAIGISIGFYLAFKVNCWYLGFIHIVSMALLWLYNTWLKKTFLIGNIVVGILTAMVVLTVIYYEQSLFTELKPRMIEIFEYILYFAWAYAGFAFLMTLIRELVKDMEDIKGDRLDNCRTVPIVWGIHRTKNLVIFLTVVVIACLIVYQIKLAGQFSESQGLAFYQVPAIRLIFTFVQLPLFYLIIELFKADKSRDFKRLSNIIKLIMMAGILYLAFLYFSVN